MDEEEEVREYRVKCLNNLAAAQLKLELHEEALSSSRDVLTLEQNNVKALFRTGKVRMEPADTSHTGGTCVWVLIKAGGAEGEGWGWVPGHGFGAGFICSDF